MMLHVAPDGGTFWTRSFADSQVCNWRWRDARLLLFGQGFSYRVCHSLAFEARTFWAGKLIEYHD